MAPNTTFLSNSSEAREQHRFRIERGVPEALVWSPVELNAFLAAEKTAHLERLWRQSPWRSLVSIGDLNPVLGLAVDFPNFEKVLEDIVGRLFFLQKAGRPVRLPPMLLLGPPGVGKTEFSARLSKLLGLPFKLLPMGSTTAPWLLSGLDAGFRASRPGEVAKVITEGVAANPLLLLDELDKAHATENGDPRNALYQLLEPTTARYFSDECYRLPMDASHINWIATANDETLIPPALRTRWLIYRVSELSNEQMLQVARSVWRGFYEDWAIAGLPKELDELSLRKLAAGNPRQMRRRLESSLSRTGLAGLKGGSTEFRVMD